MVTARENIEAYLENSMISFNNQRDVMKPLKRDNRRKWRVYTERYSNFCGK